MARQSGSPRFFEKRVLALAAERLAARLLRAGTRARRGGMERGVSSLHTHTTPAHELVYAVQGRARVLTPTESFRLSRGELLLIEPGVEHGEAPLQAPRPYRLFWLELYRSEAFLSETTYSTARGWRAGPTMDLPGRTDLQNLTTAIASELASRSWAWEDSVGALLRYLVCILVRRIRRGSLVHFLPRESPTIASDPRTWQAVQDALQFCRAHYRGRIRLADVAAAVGYSPAHLNHLFSTNLGHSVSDHVRQLRLGAARDLLENTSLPIAVISRSVGYGDPAHFTRAFSRAHKMAPKAYRQRSQPL